ncbi:MAG: hypothetical protein VYB06_06860, partial [Cyanobacteriota bacterium]|nr:hypothetical protein [Cyanobacteriota bacterium]
SSLCSLLCPLSPLRLRRDNILNEGFESSFPSRRLVHGIGARLGLRKIEPLRIMTALPRNPS